MGNGLSIPEASKASLENSVEGECIHPHCGDEGSVFVVLIETDPGCSDTRVGE